MTRVAGTLRDLEPELGRLDAVAGDGDHGRGMVKGIGAARRAVDALGQEQSQTQTFYQVTTRGITFRVSALQMTPQPDDATIAALGDIAGRQADKIKNA